MINSRKRSCAAKLFPIPPEVCSLENQESEGIAITLTLVQ